MHPASEGYAPDMGKHSTSVDNDDLEKVAEFAKSRGEATDEVKEAADRLLGSLPDPAPVEEADAD